MPVSKIKNSPELWKEYVHPDDKEKLTLIDKERQEGHLRLSYKLLLPDGEIKYIEENIFREILDGVLYSGTIKRDVTEGRKINEKVMDIKKLLTSAINYLGTNQWWKDLNGVYIGANKANLEMLKMSADEVVGKTDYDLPWGSQAADFIIKNDLKVIKTGKTIKFIEDIRMKDGEVKHLIVTKSPLRNDEGEIIGTIGSSVDITDIKRIENMLLDII